MELEWSQKWHQHTNVGAARNTLTLKRFFLLFFLFLLGRVVGVTISFWRGMHMQVNFHHQIEQDVCQCG
jgi:hypothetical protein